MKKFVVEFDCQDGLILLDSSKVRSISEEILNSLNIMLDRDGKTELIYDFPSESWQVVWERESTIFQQFCNAGNAVLFLLPGGDRRYKEIGLKYGTRTADIMLRLLYLVFGQLSLVSN